MLMNSKFDNVELFKRFHFYLAKSMGSPYGGADHIAVPLGAIAKGLSLGKCEQNVNF